MKIVVKKGNVTDIAADVVIVNLFEKVKREDLVKIK